MNSSMAYRIHIAPDAGKSIRITLPDPVIADLAAALRRLAESPTQLSKASAFPFVAGEQSFKHICAHPPYKYLFHVVFNYGQDEETLLIPRSGLTRYDLPSSPG